MSPTPASPDDRSIVRLVLLVLAVAVLAPILVMSLMMPTMGMMGWWWHDGSSVGVVPWWGFGMSLGWLVVIVVIGYVVYRAVAGRDIAVGRRDAALEELRLAYARGDLSDEEFESRRETLLEDHDRR